MVALTMAPILAGVANRVQEEQENNDVVASPLDIWGRDPNKGDTSNIGNTFPVGNDIIRHPIGGRDFGKWGTPDGTYATYYPEADRSGLLSGNVQAPTADRSQIPDVEAPMADRTHIDYANIYSEEDMNQLAERERRARLYNALFGRWGRGFQEPADTLSNAERYGVSEEDATVAGQLNQLLQEGSPYITAAQQGAMRQAAGRGLLNTSIAAGAGELAAIQSALPIAQQDAASHMELMLQKMSQGTQLSLADQATAAEFLLQKQQIGAQLALADLEVASNLLTQQIQTQAQLSIADLDAATRLMGIELDNQNKVYLQQMIEDNKLRIQHDASISTAFSNTMNSIAQMYQNDKIPWNVQNEIAEDFIDSFKSYVEFQDLTGGSNYADAFDWGKWDVRPTPEQAEAEEAAEAAERTRRAQEEEEAADVRRYPPFGRGSYNGETRSSGDARYTWNERSQRWVLRRSRGQNAPRGRISADQ